MHILRLARCRCRMKVKADFHSVQNVARSTFSERFLLNYKQSSGTNLISCGWLHTFQKKALAKNRSRDILHWMEIRLNTTKVLQLLMFWVFSKSVMRGPKSYVDWEQQNLKANCFILKQSWKATLFMFKFWNFKKKISHSAPIFLRIK